MGSLEWWIHSYAPHSSTALYAADVIAALIAFAVVIYRNRRNGTAFLEAWAINTIAAAVPIPTFILLVIAPFDHDLAKTVMEDRAVVAIAGCLGVTWAVREIWRLSHGCAKKTARAKARAKEKAKRLAESPELNLEAL